jgi:F-type H+-transporting ATPase subunit gamma|tara:strand:- start:5681 stop:6541 length:861 start_codon:yes stop_codon:yes gene_type:complete
MAVGKEVKTKISSIKSTQKITSAMEMVAASKMRKAQERRAVGKPYAIRIRSVVGQIARAASEYKHVYMEQREIKRVGYIIISTDRGLCGGLNTNLFKQVLRSMKDWSDKGISNDLCVVGNKAAGFFNSFGGNIVATVKDLGDAPTQNDLIGGVKVMLDAYEAGTIDQLSLVSNEFVNTMTQTPLVEQLLPLKPVENQELSHHWDYLYEPDAKELLDELLVRYIESQVYQGVVENKACEQAARMIAMKSATDNAGELVKELQLLYNKARQAAITQELSEIVSGAAAV